MSEGQPIGKELTSEHGLEELGKGLAQGTVSRRKALGALGGILGGSLLAALIPGVARAQPVDPGFPGNSFFPACCKEARDELGEAFPYLQGGAGQGIGRCVSDRAALLTCEDCPVACEAPPDDNDKCDKYTSRRVCVPRCPEGFRINVVTTGTAEGVSTTVTCVPRTTTPV